MRRILILFVCIVITFLNLQAADLYDLKRYVTGPELDRIYNTKNQDIPAKEIIGKQIIKAYAISQFSDIGHFRKYTIQIENPFETQQMIKLHLDYSYDLIPFQPGEIRTYTEKDMPFVSLSENTPWLEFENGQQSLIPIVKPEPSAFLLVQSENSKLSNKQQEELNKSFYQYFLPLINEEDFEDCIKKGLTRYRQECKEYTKANPTAKLRQYGEQELIDSMKYYYEIEAIDKYLEREVNIIRRYDIAYGKEAGFHSPGNIMALERLKYQMQDTTINKVRHCPYCNHKIFGKNLYCRSCKKFSPLEEDILTKPVIGCIKCGYVLIENQETCARCHQKQPEPAKRNKLYDPATKLFQVKINPAEKTPAKPGKPVLKFDQRICYPYYTETVEPISFFETATTRNILDPNWRPDIYFGIMCSQETWNKLPEAKKDQIKEASFQGGTLVLFDTEKETTQHIGFGRIIYQKESLLNNQYFLDHIQNHTYPFSKHKGRDFQPYNHSQYRKYMLICQFALWCMLPAILYYCFRKKKQGKFVMILSVAGVACLIILHVIFFAFHGIKPKMQSKEIALHDQVHGKVWTHTNHHYYQPLPTGKTFSLPKTSNHQLHFLPPEIPHSTFSYLDVSDLDYLKNTHTLVKELQKKTEVTIQHYPAGECLDFSSDNQIKMGEKLIFNPASQSIQNNYNHSIKETCLNIAGVSYKARDIASGKSKPLTPTTREHWNGTPFGSDFNEYQTVGAFIEYLEYNQLDYAVSLLEKRSDFKITRDCHPTESESYMITIMGKGGSE